MQGEYSFQANQTIPSTTSYIVPVQAGDESVAHPYGVAGLQVGVNRSSPSDEELNETPPAENPVEILNSETARQCSFRHLLCTRLTRPLLQEEMHTLKRRC